MTDELARRLESLIGRAHERARKKLEVAVQRLSPARAAARTGEGSVRLALARAALDANFGARLEERRARLEVAVASLDALSPLGVLGRGYSLAQDSRGRLLRESRAVSVGERVRVRLAQGSLHCRVEEVEDEN
jgi:exodeoxyribonuclease VII large subunit